MTSATYGVYNSGQGQAKSHNAQLIQQHNMTSSMFVDRGLLNKPGENNCFLNSAIQVLWHIEVFRRSFRQLRGHYCLGNSCIFCALRTIFMRYQYGSESAIPPNEVRSALATCFKEQHKFQLGLMEDATECYEEILGQMHFHLTGNHDDDTCDVPHCISHQKFAMTLLERTECKCGATSEPLPMVQFIHYYSVTALLKELDKLKNLKLTVEKDPKIFSLMLHRAYCIDNNRECPNYLNCHQQVRPAQILLNTLDVVCIGLIWDSDQPTVDIIQSLSEAIGLQIKLDHLFDQLLTEESKNRDYHLTAVITYYGKHYSTFCYHGDHKEWVYLDDANVRKVGTRWSDVKELFKKGHYQPLLLLYTCRNATPVDITSAPATDIITMPTASGATTYNTATVVDVATVANGHLRVHTNTMQDEHLIAGVGVYGSDAQPRPLAVPQDATVPILPPPSHPNKSHQNNIVNNNMLPEATRSPRASPTPVANCLRISRGISPASNATDSNNKKEDLIVFESISSQLIAAANHNPYPNYKPYPGNALANEIPPLSTANQPHVHSSNQMSILHPHVNASIMNSNAQVADDLIVLDTLKATEITKMKQESLKNKIGPFEQDMIVVARDSSLSDKPGPHHRGVTGTNHFHSEAVVTGVTTNQLAPANSNAQWKSQSLPRQRCNSTPQKPSNQMQAGQLSYREGFGVSQSEVLCVEAMQMWVKAETSLAKGDKTEGLLAYQQVSDILQRALLDQLVQANIKQRSQIISKRNEATRQADSLKKAIDSEKRLKQHSQNTTRPQLQDYQKQHNNTNGSHSDAKSCKNCGRIDHKPGSDLCGPCEMKQRFKR